MYRVLADAAEVRERRNQLRHPAYTKPELLATGPNEVWSWDITKLPGPAKWTSYSLYVILDIFSRYVVGWMVAAAENATLAARLITATCEKPAITPGQLTIHADRGTAMTAKPLALLLADLGVTRTHSRPHVSDDNPSRRPSSRPSSTTRRSPRASGRSRTPAPSARAFSGGTTRSTATTPSARCRRPSCTMGRAAAAMEGRRQVLAAAYAAHPERFVRRPPQPLASPTAAWINRPAAPAALTNALHY
jgi:putative transposase